MRFTPHVLITSCLLTVVPTVVQADSVIDQILASKRMTETVKFLGQLCLCNHKTAEQVKAAKAQVRQNVYWAFSPDVRLAEPERAAASEDFDRMWDSLQSTSQQFDADEVSFIGCDAVALLKCLDMYYVAVTPRGPVVFKFAMEIEVGDHARLMRISTFRGWDEVKLAIKNIQHTDPNKIPTISWSVGMPTSQPVKAAG